MSDETNAALTLPASEQTPEQRAYFDGYFDGAQAVRIIWLSDGQNAAERHIQTLRNKRLADVTASYKAPAVPPVETGGGEQQQWTAEPWHVHRVDLDRINAGDGRWIAHFRSRYSSMTAAEMEANAARAVECINALAGIQDPAAFVTRIRELVWIVRRSAQRGQRATDLVGGLFTMAGEVEPDYAKITPLSPAPVPARVSADAQRIGELEAENDRLATAIQDVRDWCLAYPEDVFPSPTPEQLKRAQEVLTKHVGISVDSTSAAMGRHILGRLEKDCAAALAAKTPNTESK